MTDQELLRHITRSAGNKAGYKQLVRELGLGGGAQRRKLLEQLAKIETTDLEDKKLVDKVRDIFG